MESVDVLSGVQAEVEEFNVSELKKMPLWPYIPTPCPVDVCTEIYNSFSSFERHWNNKHSPTRKILLLRGH